MHTVKLLLILMDLLLCLDLVIYLFSLGFCRDITGQFCALAAAGLEAPIFVPLPPSQCPGMMTQFPPFSYGFLQGAL